MTDDLPAELLNLFLFDFAKAQLKLFVEVRMTQLIPFQRSAPPMGINRLSKVRAYKFRAHFQPIAVFGANHQPFQVAIPKFAMFRSHPLVQLRRSNMPSVQCRNDRKPM